MSKPETVNPGLVHSRYFIIYLIQNNNFSTESNVEDGIIVAVERYFAEIEAMVTPVKFNVLFSLKDIHGHVFSLRGHLRFSVQYEVFLGAHTSHWLRRSM